MKQYLRYRIKLAQEMDQQALAADAAGGFGYPPPAVPQTPADLADKRKQFYKRLLGYGLVSGGGYVLGASTSAALAELLSKSDATKNMRSLSAADKMRRFGPYIGLATGAAGLATALMWANSKRKAEEESGYAAPPPAPAPTGNYPHVSPRMPVMPVSRIYNRMRNGRVRETLMSTMMAEPKPGEFDIE